MKATEAFQKAAMYGRGGHNDLQSWKEKFVQLMQKHKPRDKWTLEVSEDLSLSPHGWYQYGQKHLFARFECSGCPNCWKSAWSALLFHIRREQNRGQVKMRMFRQKCRRCTMARYEEPVFSEKALETILYNLVLKILEKSYGEPKRSPRHCEAEETVEGPHEKSHCEACQHGMCIETRAPWPRVVPTSLAPSIEWEENFMRLASLTPSVEWQRDFVRPASVPRRSEWEECHPILLAFLVVILIFVLFCAFSFPE